MQESSGLKPDWFVAICLFLIKNKILQNFLTHGK